MRVVVTGGPATSGRRCCGDWGGPVGTRLWESRDVFPRNHPSRDR